MISRILLALGAGMVGALGNTLSITLINVFLNNPTFDKQFIYKQVFWGALWALPYCFNFFHQHWIAKGILVSFTATFFTFFIFQSLPLNFEFILRALFVNMLVWGGISSWVYHFALTKKDSI